MEEVFETAFVADDPNPYVDEKTCDCPVGIPEALASEPPRKYPKGELSRLRAPARDKTSARSPAE